MTSARSTRESTTATHRRRLAFGGVEQRLLARWKANGPTRGTTVAVGFSGGPDSLCLAAALGRISPRFECQIVLIHIDHRLRTGSASEAEHARVLAGALGMTFEVAMVPEGVTSRHPGVGLEEAARRERYVLLSQHASKFGTDVIAVGHHRDDQAETVMLHLLRGAGLTGAAGMREWTELAVPWWMPAARTTLKIWRPLLNEPKSELRLYLDQVGLEPNFDDSNEDLAFRRNAIRHRLLPVIDEIAPAGRAVLARFAEIAGAEDRFLDELAAEATASVIGEGGELLVGPAIRQPSVIRRRVLATWLARVLPDGIEPTYERITALEAFLHAEAHEKLLEIGGGRVAMHCAGSLLAGTRGHIEDLCWSSFPGPRPNEHDRFPQMLRIGETLTFAHFTLAIAPGAGKVDGSPLTQKLRLSARDVVAPLVLRIVERGDRFASGELVADWLAGHDVPVLLRKSVLCVAGIHGVIWVPGLDLPRADEPSDGEATVEASWSIRA